MHTHLRHALMILVILAVLLSGLRASADTIISAGTITANVTWSTAGSPYIVNGVVTIAGTPTTPATLTIQPGVTVKFASTGGLTIGSGTNQGALVSQGTSTSRITLTRNAASGTWTGITFNDATVDGTTVIANADIQYSTGIKINYAFPTISNSTITNVTGYGMNLASSNPALTNVTISSSGTYGIYLSSSSPRISGGSLTNTYSGGHGIYGTGSPVVSNYTVSIVNSSLMYGIYLSSGATSSLSVTNSTIGNGLYLGSTGITPTISGNTFTNADNSPIHAGANIIGQIMNNNTVSGMTSAGKIEVVGEQIKQDAQWTKWAAPYIALNWISVYKDAANASTLTVEPGVIVKFAQNTGIQVGSTTAKGNLVTRGTATGKVVFTSNQTSPTPGFWSGISLYNDTARASTLEQTVIEYGGAGAASSNANLVFNGSSPLLKNCQIRNSAGSGIYMTNATAWPLIVDSELTGNKWGVYSSNSNPAIMNTKITGNATAGVTNVSTSVDVDARDNWWGLATGPTHSSNPRGTGDKISVHVLYNPWLGQSPDTALSITDAKVLPTSMNPDGDYVTIKAAISSSATWTITIMDGANATVRTFGGTGTAINQKWYGENSQAVKVADGAYYCKIEAYDSVSGSSAATPQGMIVVSRQLPIAIMDSPADNQTFQCGSMIGIMGTASDAADFKNYSLDYGIGENPTTWTNLKTSTTPTTNGSLHTWNTSSLGSYVYTLRLKATDNAGNVATETSRVRFLCIQNAASSESHISPNGDGIKDAAVISAMLTNPATWTVTVKNATAVVMRTYTKSGSAITQPWDGKNGAGQVVPDGAYTYQIDAVSPDGTVSAVPAIGAITVDLTNPAAAITSPVSGAVLWNSVLILGTAIDVNLDNYRVEYGPSSGTGPWSLISSATTSVSSGTLSTWVTNDPTNAVLVQNGSYGLRLVVTDKAGNNTTTTVPVSMSNLILSNIGVSSNTLDTSAAQTSTVFFTINSQATVTFKVIPERQGPAGIPVYQAPKACSTGEAYSFVWDGKDATGKVVPDEAYLIVLEASNGTKTDSYSPPQPTGTGSVACTWNSAFSAIRNIPMTITYVPSQAARVNIDIAWGMQNFRIVDAVAAAAGSNSFDWDVRNQSGAPLNEGARVTCTVAALIRENHIITTGDTVKISGMKTDPYAVDLSYGQFTRLQYILSQAAVVTITVRTPDGLDITVLDSQLQGDGQQEVIWTGLDSTDADGKRFLAIKDGDCTVAIQAINPATGSSSTMRGNLGMGL